MDTKQKLMMEKVRTRMCDQFEFFSELLTNFNIREDKTIPYAAGVYVKNQSIHMLYNPDQFFSYSQDIQIGIFEHEVMHIILEHFNRELGRDHELANISEDLAINKNLVPENMLFKGVCIHDELPFNLPPNKTFEEYYNLINDNESLKQKVMAAYGSKKIILVDDHNLQKELGDTFGLSPEIIKEMVKKAVDKVSYGKVPGNIKTLIDEILKPPKAPWKQILRMFVNKNVKGQQERNWSRFNKRLPGLIPGKKKAYIPKLIVGIDCSGSISDDQLEQFCAEIKQIHKMKCPVHVIVFDVDVHDHYDFDGKFHEIEARGGTSFIQMFELARKMKDCSAIVVLTDLYGQFPQDTKYPQTLWIVTQDGADFNSVPFGKCIRIEI